MWCVDILFSVSRLVVISSYSVCTYSLHRVWRVSSYRASIIRRSVHMHHFGNSTVKPLPKTSSYSAGQQLSVFFNPKVYYHTHKSPPMDSNLCELNSFHYLTPSLSKTYSYFNFSLILPTDHTIFATLQLTPMWLQL